MSSAASERELIVLRIGEIFLKGRNRRTFFAQFVRNARRLVGDVDGAEVEGQHLRAVVRYPASARSKVVARLSRLFGMSSMAVAVGCEKSVEGASAAAVEVAKGIPAGATFKIETKRADKRFAVRSPEVSRQVGGAVHVATGLAVDVRNPDHVIRVEIAPEGAFVFHDTIDGPGGLPVGVSGKVGLLLSGGIDSPVAGWSAMRRGCTVQAIYFHSFPYTGDKTKEKVLDIARILARWQGDLAVDVVHFTEVQKALREAGPAELAVLLYRRMMVRAASILAARARCTALVTGENLGQVASQTLQNLSVIQDAATMPILRPLIAYDKTEIIAKARAIDTFETSILPYEDCCALFVPKHPATRGRLDDLRRAEDKLDIAALATELADNAERIVVS